MVNALQLRQRMKQDILKAVQKHGKLEIEPLCAELSYASGFRMETIKGYMKELELQGLLIVDEKEIRKIQPKEEVKQP